MSTEENKAILHRFYDEVFNQGNVALIDELIAPEAIDHEKFPGVEGSAREVARYFVTHIRSAFPDLHLQVHDLLAEGDKVVGRISMSGTHQGEFMGIEATGRAMTVNAIDIVRFANGKAVEHWAITDIMGMMQQLGVVPG